MFLFLCLTSAISSSVPETWLPTLFLHISHPLFKGTRTHPFNLLPVTTRLHQHLHSPSPTEPITLYFWISIRRITSERSSCPSLISPNSNDFLCHNEIALSKMRTQLDHFLRESHHPPSKIHSLADTQAMVYLSTILVHHSYLRPSIQLLGISYEEILPSG